MACCDQPGLMPFEQGLERILAAVRPCTETETVPLQQASHRILANTVTAKAPVPSCDNSAMDGYALRLADLAADTPMPVQARALAGHPVLEPLKAGHCIRIMTGAVIPAGCDTVIMQENAEVTEHGVRFTTPGPLGDNVRRAGENVREGRVVAEPGQSLSAIDLGLLATVGVSEVEVIRRPRVALFSTGDELRQPGEPLKYGDLYDSNRVAIHALLQRMGAEVHDLGVIPDNPQAIREAFEQGDRNCDFVITSGGVSVGEADFTRDILNELGDIDFWKLAIKPGKPLAFGRLQNSYFLGLPGNPVSSLVTLHLLGCQALRQFMGLGHQPLKQLTAIATEPLKKSPGRMDFQRGLWWQEGGEIRVKSTASNQGSHVFSSLQDANCYIALEQDRGPVNAGESVTLWLFDELMR
ncbi:MAG: molybdopterin molybdotransferase MoeA [Saccharospirillum sp.]